MYSVPLTKVQLAIGSKEHHESDLPESEKDYTDLDVMLDVQPLEIIYRAETIGDIARFFKAKKMTSETKLAAQAQYAKLTSQMSNITTGIEKDFKNNKVSIKVSAPTLVIPFE